MKRNVYSAALLLILDIFVTAGSVFLAKYIQRLLPEVCLPDELLWAKAIIYSGVGIICFYFQDLYNWRYWRRSSELTSSILLGGGITLIVLAVLYYILPVIGLERDVLLIALGITLGSSFFLRLVFLKLKFANNTGARVVILGDGENAKFLFQQMRSGGYPVSYTHLRAHET